MCPDEPADTPLPERLACSFCGKGVDAVGKLITAPAACICDECIDLCNDLIEGDFDHGGDRALRSGFGSPPCDLCRLPKSAAELVPISFGAQLCRACIDAVREVIERERTGG